MHRDGKKHGNADAMSRLPPSSEGCDEYLPEIPLTQLPCGGCQHCTRRQQEWADFAANVDDVVPLTRACRQVLIRSQAKPAPGSVNPDQPTEEAKPTPSLGCVDSGVTTGNWAGGFTTELLRNSQLEDPDLSLLHDWLNKGQKPRREFAASLSPAACGYWLNFEQMRIVNGVAVMNWVDSNGVKPTATRVLVPAKLRHQVLQACHDSLFSGHLGVRKTIDRVKQKFHWPGMSTDVKDHIRNCLACTACKSPFKRYRAALADFRVGAPMDRVAIDLIGPLPLTTRKNRYILVLVDYFTRWLEAFPLPDQTAETVAHKMVTEFVCRFVAPLEIHTDQGCNFESDLFQEVCCLLEITKTRTTAYHPSSNGLVERCSGTLGSMIRSYLEDGDKDWDRFIPMLTAAYRSTVHSSTGFTPNYMMLGRETTTPVDLQFPCLDYEQGESSEYAQELRRQLSRCYEIARVNLKRATERQLKTHDTRISQHRYTPGQAVMKRSHKHSKLQVPWVGPYIVQRALSDCLYVIADRRKTFAIHHDSLKPVPDAVCPAWARKLQHNFLSKH